MAHKDTSKPSKPQAPPRQDRPEYSYRITKENQVRKETEKRPAPKPEKR